MKTNPWTNGDDPPDMTPAADQAFQLMAVFALALAFSSQEFMNLEESKRQATAEPYLIIATSKELVLMGEGGEKRFRRNQLDLLIQQLPAIEDPRQPPTIGISTEKTNDAFDLQRPLKEAGYRVKAARFTKNP